jgi:DnaJ-class molecular chaperone
MRGLSVANFEEIDKARKLLGLGEHATLKQVKQAYRRMANEHHPDKAENRAQAEQMMKQINAAYKLLSDYCASFSYSFREEDVARAYPHDEYLRKFKHGWFDGA